MPSVSTIDLTKLDAVKGWGNVQSSADDDAIAACITAFSQYVLTRTGRDSLNSVASYTEVYDGNGSQKLPLRNYPVVTLTGVAFLAPGGGGTYTPPLSTGFGIGGVAIDQSRRRLVYMPGSGSAGISTFYPTWMASAAFPKGIQNIQIQYTAGYGATPPDLEMAVRRTVSLNYKGKNWQGLASESMSVQGGSGTTRYVEWEMMPNDERVILSYERKVPI